MKIDDKRFYPANWQDFIHKGAIVDLFKLVPEIDIPDLEAATIDKINYQKDANGEYRMLVDYTDGDGVSHNTIINPAITQRVIALANQEVVKHFLYHQNGADINIQTMQFIDDKLKLNLVDGQTIELDLKPLVPRINVVGPDGEILQKDLNYHVSDDCIIFVDLHGNETKLDFKKLVHIDAYQQDQAHIQEQFTNLDHKKLNKDEFDRFTLTNQAALDTKEAKTDHAADVKRLQAAIDTKASQIYVDDQFKLYLKLGDFNTFKEKILATMETKADKSKMAIELDKKEDKQSHAQDVADLQGQINDRTTHAETDAAVTKTVKQIKEWAEPLHEDLQQAIDAKVNQVVFNELKKRVEDLNSLKVNKTDYDRDKATFATLEQLGDYVTRHYLTSNHYTKAEIDAFLKMKVDNAALSDLQKLLQTQIDSKANASDVKADHYTKAEVDALIKTVQPENRQVFMPYVGEDGNWHVKLVKINSDGSVTDVEKTAPQEPQA